MLKQIKTKNFRKLEDRTFDFGAGVQAIRGGNELGKSTLLEAIAYGLFGATACRDPLTEVVTWGRAEKDLRVDQVWEFDGVEYALKRSKSGAEINYPDGKVVGQKEVTAFMEKLLGCSAAAAGNLMLASQGLIRGALEQGPAKTGELIEDLADVKIIDRIVDLIQAKLPTGPTTTAEERVAAATAALEGLRAVAQVPDTDSLKVKVVALATESELVTQAAADLRPQADAAQAAVQAAEVAKRTRDSLKGQLEAAQRNQALRQQQLKDAQQAAASAPAPDAAENLGSQIRAAENINTELGVYAEFSRLSYPETAWEGDRTSFDEAREAAQAAETAATVAWQAAVAEERRLITSKQTGIGVCKSCGQKLPNADAVAAHNAKIDAEIVGVRAEVSRTSVALTAAKADVQALQGVANAAVPFDTFAAKHANRVTADIRYVPPALAWQGPVPNAEAVQQLPARKAELARVLAAVKAAETAAARAEALIQALTEDATTMAKLEADIAAITAPEQLPALRATFDAVNSQYQTVVGRLTEIRFEKKQTEEEIVRVEGAYAAAKAAIAAGEAAIVTAKADLESLRFNNELLKRVRAARPLIADKLWTMVLSAASTYFSSMRGTPSVVTREGKAFKVDGRAGALSGSTLDILGLAIRVALTRSFLPLCPFLVLDEPAAAMDRNRELSMLGFLVSTGFPQTLLVTHSDIDETVAQSIICL